MCLLTDALEGRMVNALLDHDICVSLFRSARERMPEEPLNAV